MGEAPGYLVDGSDEFQTFGFDSEWKSSQTTTDLHEKIYVVGGSDGETNLPISIKIFDKLAGKWLIPTVLGTKPFSSKGHSATLVSNDRILILKGGSMLDDSAWFIEVDTPFVREKKKIVGTEVVAWSKGVIGDRPKPVVISGPSGVGKGTLISQLMKEFPTNFGFSVSHTTRAPREKEKDGVHYHFMERSAMEEDIRHGRFLESASVHGNLYGTSIEAVEAVTDSGKRCILDIDVQGARSVRATSLQALLIFICPPSFEELEKRLRGRGTETEEQVQKRLRNSRAELEQGRSSGLFDHILVNDKLETCYENLKGILALEQFLSPIKQASAACQPSMEYFEVPVCHSVSKTEQLVKLQANEIIGPSCLFTLDLSSLEGGAPGRTRGLKIHDVIMHRDDPSNSFGST